MCGLLTMISALTDDVPWRHDLLLTVEPGRMMALGHVLALGAGAVLIYLARGILDRRRRALDATIVVLVAVAVLDLVKGLDFEEAGVALALAALLARGRRACTRRTASRPPLFAATVAVGTIAAFYVAMCAAFAIPGRKGSLAGTVARGAKLLGSGGWLHASEPTRALLTLLFAAAVTAIAVAVRSLLRPVAAREGHSAEGHARAVRIVRAFGRDSLAPFVLREDKAFFFARGGFLAYRTLRETAVVSGDPIGPPGSARAILEEFLGYADRCGWRVAVAAASPELAELAPSVGLRRLQVGSEAVVNAQAFTLEGRSVRKVRQAIARVKRHGWTSVVVAARGSRLTDAPRGRGARARVHVVAAARLRLRDVARKTVGRARGRRRALCASTRPGGHGRGLHPLPALRARALARRRPAPARDAQRGVRGARRPGDRARSRRRPRRGEPELRGLRAFDGADAAAQPQRTPVAAGG
jgi:lysylphosphatidylglycerol synthetase-like protein (DUF2156 family)